MTNEKLKLVIQSDDDGYVSYECPFCQSVFGLNVAEVQCDDPIYNEMYCPYCGLSDKPSNFYTKEAIKQIQNLAMNYVNEEINSMLKKVSKNSKNLKLTYKPLRNCTTRELKTIEGNDEIFECNNCYNHVKVNYNMGKTKVYCAFCGIDIC